MRLVSLAASIALALGSACATTAGMPASATTTAPPTGTCDAATSGVVVVANQQSASATIVDVATRRATTVPVGSGPHEAAVSPDAHWAVVTIYGTQQPGNQLAVLDLATHAVARTIDLGELRRPHGSRSRRAPRGSACAPTAPRSGSAATTRAP